MTPAPRGASFHRVAEIEDSEPVATMTQTRLAKLFEHRFGKAADRVARLEADGSTRTYFRITAAGLSVIGAHGPDGEENHAFLRFSDSFRRIGLPVPEIYVADEAAGIWLEEDLGDTTLFRALTDAREHELAEFPASLVPVYERVADLLPRFQIEGGRVIDYGDAYPRAAFDLQSMHWDLNYFKYHFLKLAHIPFSEQRLENDFERLATFLLEADTSHFLYRDFQSRNIMLRQGQPWFIDYQGGRRGAPHYDIASLLYDAKAAIPDAVRERILDRYLQALDCVLPIDRRQFLEHYRGYVLIRIMQAMGAYGYRGLFERKPRFLQSVPHAARNLALMLDAGLPIALPELEAIFGRIVNAFAGRSAQTTPVQGLTIRIVSFSYRGGYPEDGTGHGGGYVFDCRALPNPGRRSEFMSMSGLDPEVIAFLEGETEVHSFWDRVRTMVDAHVEDFRHRHFSDLSVAFGCTGGQHRSVYFAERLGNHLRARFPDVSVNIAHRESHSWRAAAAATSAAASS
jgi:aminoglycoside/choline kinase family phosphotransferase